MSVPLISVIIPCYNTEPYIDECLISLANQTLKDIEIICVEDGSTDGTFAKLSDWEKKDSRVIVIRHDKNKGLGSARNAGIRMAKADYVAFVDSDDFVTIDKYQCLYNLSQGGSLDLVVFSQHILYGETEKIITQIPKHLTDIDNIRRYVLVHGFSIWKSIVKKEVIYKNNLFFPDYLYYEDAPVSTCLFLCAKSIAVYYDKPLHYYRRNNYTSITQKKGDLKFFDRLETAIMFYNNTKRLGFYNRYNDEIEYAFFYLFYKNTILGALLKFDNNPPANIIKTIPKRYKATTSVNIKKNPYYKMNKPPMFAFLVAHYPEFTPLWIQMYNAWGKGYQLLYKTKQLLHSDKYKQLHF